MNNLEPVKEENIFFYFQCSVTQIGLKSYQTVLHKKNND